MCVTMSSQNNLIILLSLMSIQTVFLWPDHDISTLKSLQLVHRHGDRAIVDFYPNDPFAKNMDKYFPEGDGNLAVHGKYRMHKIGQFIRQAYQQYLGDAYSPREVYVRSSAKPRCLESTEALLSGLYPPQNNFWQ